MFLKQLSYRSFLKKLHGLTVRETCMHRKREISLSLCPWLKRVREEGTAWAILWPSIVKSRAPTLFGPIRPTWARPGHMGLLGFPFKRCTRWAARRAAAMAAAGGERRPGLPCRRRGRGRREIRGPPPPSSAQAAARAGLSGNGRNHHSLPYGPRAASMGLYGCPQPHEQCSTHFAKPQPQPLACRTDWWDWCKFSGAKFKADW